MKKLEVASTIVAFVLALSASASATTFTVTSTADTDGSTCGAGCTLRQAINASNANPPPANTTNLINFNIPGAGVHTITLTNCLGSTGNFCFGLTQPVVIDGYTQPGASANTLTTGDNAKILIKIIGDLSSDAVIRLCSPTACGIAAGNDSSGSTVKGLCLVGNTNTPNNQLIFVGSDNDTVTGNFLGVDTNGVTVVSDGTPVQVGNGGSHATSTIIGGTAPAARNVIVSNGGFALILIDGDNTLVQGNYLGVNAAGTAPLGSCATGIDIEEGSGNTIGGTAAGAGNVINATGNGISVGGVCGGCLFDTTIRGNLIGTGATGTVALQALSNGIVVASSPNTTIGGSTSTAANVITARGDGIMIGGNQTGVVIQGNKIGTDRTGTMPLGNGACGIAAGDTTTGTIGGMNAGEGNTIAFNGANGVSVAGSAGDNTSWAVLGNSIHDNALLGITLAASGCGSTMPTPNDPGDTDDGANGLQNYPVLTSVTNSGGMTHIAGTLNSEASKMYRVEFFANDAIDSSGFGEGQTFLGFTNVTTNGSGNASFNVGFPQLAATQYVTTTATDPNGNTSEFSAAIGQLLNISTRMNVLTGNSVLIGGFIIGGPNNKKVVVRGLGPTLTQFGVTGVLADPTLELHNGAGTVIASNDNWKDTQQAAIMATGLAPPNNLESAILATLLAGNYTAILRGKNNTTGIGLVEVYDVDKAFDTTLTNISTRGFVDVNENVMIGGFISGNGVVKVIIRALGPTLSQFGVTNILADPTLELHDGNGTLLASNDNWKDTQQAEIQASGFAPPNDLESAIITTRPPANSTAIVRGKNNTTGNALVEVYFLSP